MKKLILLLPLVFTFCKSAELIPTATRATELRQIVQQHEREYQSGQRADTPANRAEDRTLTATADDYENLHTTAVKAVVKAEKNEVAATRWTTFLWVLGGLVVTLCLGFVAVKLKPWA